MYKGNHPITTLTKAICSLILALAVSWAMPALAGFSLVNEASTVSLMSTKVLADGTHSVIERHRFTGLSGSIDENGMAEVVIELNSIETGIPIRNERMREVLFETDSYPTARITAMVPAELLEKGVHRVDLTIDVELHGSTQQLLASVVVQSTGNEAMVTATEPVLLDAANFELAGGVGRLAEIAQLLHIPTTVPVSFTLKLRDQ